MALYQIFKRCIAEEVAVVVTTLVAGPGAIGSKMLVYADGSADGHISPPELACRVAGDAIRLLRAEESNTMRYEIDGNVYDVFLEAHPSPKQLVILGASHAAGPLSSFGKAMGYRIIITDARAAFAVPERFPDADQVLKGWPQDVLPGLRLDESTYVVLLSHDPKFDEPTLQQVLPSRVRYIGAIGSKRTQQARFERLRQEGYTEEQLARIYGPVGLDIGGRTPEETAVAILAEITAVRHGRSGGFMRNRPREPVTS